MEQLIPLAKIIAMTSSGIAAGTIPSSSRFLSSGLTQSRRHLELQLCRRPSNPRSTTRGSGQKLEDSLHYRSEHYAVPSARHLWELRLPCVTMYGPLNPQIICSPRSNTLQRPNFPAATHNLRSIQQDRWHCILALLSPSQ
jgi:hypothetical protein